MPRMNALSSILWKKSLWNRLIDKLTDGRIILMSLNFPITGSRVMCQTIWTLSAHDQFQLPGDCPASRGMNEISELYATNEEENNKSIDYQAIFSSGHSITRANIHSMHPCCRVMPLLSHQSRPAPGQVRRQVRGAPVQISLAVVAVCLTDHYTNSLTYPTPFRLLTALRSESCMDPPSVPFVRLIVRNVRPVNIESAKNVFWR